MGLRLKTFFGGTIEIVPTDTSSNVTISVQASNGVLSTADSANGGMYLPVGTTEQRPSPSTIGQMRFNTTTGSVETYNGTSWG